ncbi:MAG TPA: L-2-amino-thiazoline-4-carboxylic acid hydrolase [Gemmatimonadales bacterium]|nr:L-2-amino-thiazoline-4-carboxylic acid hydrolase [Gemmatimonadales bacterium]
MSVPSDVELNAIGVLKRRTIEARILAPVIKAMAAEFGQQRVHAVLGKVIIEIAKSQGAAMAATCDGNSPADLAGTLDRWKADGALEMDVLEQNDVALSYNVTRCRYAEMYRELDIPELGAILSCGRDGALIEGFNPLVQLTRTQTLLSGASHCDFRYRRADGRAG